MSQKANDLQRREIAELQTRSAKYQSQVAGLEISCHNAQDQARESAAMLDRLRSETANLRAERDTLKVCLTPSACRKRRLTFVSSIWRLAYPLTSEA